MTPFCAAVSARLCPGCICRPAQKHPGAEGYSLACLRKRPRLNQPVPRQKVSPSEADPCSRLL
eukprot:6376767-Lingulodinium_polyedra.AAC.1